MKGDVGAQIAVTEMGAARVAELAERFGADTLQDAFAAILKGAADELAGRIAKLPAGTAEAHGFIDSDGVDFSKPVKLAVKVTIADGRATFDFSGSDPQAKGPVNLRPSMIEACVFYCLIGSLGPDLAFNDGMRDCVDIVLAPRTVTNAEPPGAVSNYQMVNLKLVDVILEAMAALNPGARGGRRRLVERDGHHLGEAAARARPTCNTRSSARPMAAARRGDGASGTAAHLSNLHITPIEILESEFPCRIRRFEMRAGLGRRGHAPRRPQHGARVRVAGGRHRHPPLRQVEVSPQRPRRRRDRRRRAASSPASARRHEKQSPPGRYEMKAGDRFILQTRRRRRLRPARASAAPKRSRATWRKAT